MEKTIWYNENSGRNCVSDKDFEKYERIIGFDGEGNQDVSLRVMGFASINEDISNRRYSFKCDVNMRRGSVSWLKTLERMKFIIEREIEYTNKRKGKDYIAPSTKRSCFLKADTKDNQ